MGRINIREIKNSLKCKVCNKDDCGCTPVQVKTLKNSIKNENFFFEQNNHIYVGDFLVKVSKRNNVLASIFYNKLTGHYFGTYPIFLKNFKESKVLSHYRFVKSPFYNGQIFRGVNVNDKFLISCTPTHKNILMGIFITNGFHNPKSNDPNKLCNLKLFKGEFYIVK